VAVRQAHSSIYKYHNRLAWVADFAVGLLLSLEMLPTLAIRIERFSPELGWISGQDEPTAGVWECDVFGAAEREEKAASNGSENSISVVGGPRERRHPSKEFQSGWRLE
jgi:hypothetical protein